MKPYNSRRGAYRPAKFVLTAVCMAAIGSIALNANAALDVIAPPPATDPSDGSRRRSRGWRGRPARAGARPS